MANEVEINTNQNPAFIPSPSGSHAGFIAAIIVADINTLNAVAPGSVPTKCMAFVRSTGTLFLTEDAGTSWTAYS
jgi:hypothetical protein